MTRLARPALLMLTCLALAACGADGEPVRPSANVGVSMSDSGLHTGASVGVRKGPWNLTWGQYF